MSLAKNHHTALEFVKVVCTLPNKKWTPKNYTSKITDKNEK